MNGRLHDDSRGAWWSVCTGGCGGRCVPPTCSRFPVGRGSVRGLVGLHDRLGDAAGRSPRGRWRGPTRGSPRSGPGSTGPASSPPRAAALRDRDPGHRPYELHRCTGRERHAASRRSGRRVRPDRGVTGTAAHGLDSCHASVCPRRSWGGRRGVPAGARAVRVDLRRRRADTPDRPRHPAAAVDRGRVLRTAAAPDGPPVRGARHGRGQPADRPVPRRGGRARRHARAARRRPDPGPRLGRVDHDPVLRGAHRHRPDRAAA